MPRYKLTIEYDGNGFVGWQRQANGLSIQEAIETAAEPLGCPRGGIHGAGRTDAGVHATGQVAHLDLAKAYRADSVRDAINSRLKAHRISVRAVALVAPISTRAIPRCGGAISTGSSTGERPWRWRPGKAG